LIALRQGESVACPPHLHQPLCSLRYTTGGGALEDWQKERCLISLITACRTAICTSRCSVQHQERPLGALCATLGLVRAVFPRRGRRPSLSSLPGAERCSGRRGTIDSLLGPALHVGRALRGSLREPCRAAPAGGLELRHRASRTAQMQQLPQPLTLHLQAIMGHACRERILTHQAVRGGC